MVRFRSPLIQFGGSSLSPQASRARLHPEIGSWQVLGGDAVEAVEPLFEAAVVGVDVVDVQMGRLRGWLSRREHRVERNPGSAGEGGDWPAAVADQMVVLCDDAGKRSSYGSPVDLRQDRVEGRTLPVAGDENWNIGL